MATNTGGGVGGGGGSLILLGLGLNYVGVGLGINLPYHTRWNKMTCGIISEGQAGQYGVIYGIVTVLNSI